MQFFRCHNIHFLVFSWCCDNRERMKRTRWEPSFCSERTSLSLYDKSCEMQTWHMKHTRHRKHTWGKHTTRRARRQEAPNRSTALWRGLWGSDKREQTKNVHFHSKTHQKTWLNVHMVYIFRDAGKLARCSLTFSHILLMDFHKPLLLPLPQTHLRTSRHAPHMRVCAQTHTHHTHTYTATNTFRCVHEKTRCQC